MDHVNGLYLGDYSNRKDRFINDNNTRRLMGTFAIIPHIYWLSGCEVGCVPGNYCHAGLAPVGRYRR